MDAEAINKRCVELMQHPDVQNHLLHPRMFWEVGNLDDPGPEDLTQPKVDLRELEVMLSEYAHQPSQCLEELNAERPGRGDTIRHMVHRGDMPLLMRADDVDRYPPV